MANKIFNLDLTKDTKINSIVLGRVGDGGLQTITVNIANRDVPVDLTGFTITFEGVTNSSQSKIFDSYGVKTETEKLKQGQFDYTFPSAAFSVAGRYETAYFSFQKDENRDTTGKIDIFVSENADIDAGEAESIITEYNKLVQELHEITDKYISDSDAKFSDLNTKISDLQTKITQYQNTVKNTADGAIKAVEDALKKFEAGDFYTKSETDAKFKVVNDLIISQDIPEGSNLDDYKKEGEFSKKTPTVVTGVPEGVSGAFRLSVRSMVGSSGIFQTLYDYATRGIYYRVGNTSLGFNLPWQRIANNSEVVHLTGDETIEGKKTFTEDLVAKSISTPSDTGWVNLTPGTGVLVPSGALLMYKINAGDITIIASNVQTTIDSNGQKLLTTLPVSLFDSLTFVETAFTGNATDAWRVGISKDGLYVAGTSGVRSNYVCFSVKLPLN